MVPTHDQSTAMSAGTTGLAMASTRPEAMPLGETALGRMALPLVTRTTAANGPSKASAARPRVRVAMTLAATTARLKATTRMHTKVHAETTAEPPRLSTGASHSTPGLTPAKPMRIRANPPSSARSKTTAACVCPS